MTAPAGVPATVMDIVCPDGRRLRLRPIQASDAPRLVALHERLSAHTLYQRYFSVLRRLPSRWAQQLANADHEGRDALVVEEGPPESPALVAVGCYEPTADPGTVEVAFVVADRWQGQGVGTALFRELLRVAESRGIRRCRAYVLADNARMVDLISRFATVHTRSLDQGVLILEFTPRPARQA